MSLSGLSDRQDLNGITYDQLHSDLNLQNDLVNFENQTIRTVVIRGWHDEKYLYSVFLRINTGSVQLSPQELRQALHPGKFSDFIDDFSITSNALRSALKLKQPDFRMRDVELVLRFFAYKNLASEYAGDLKEFLDNATKQFNRSWSKESEDLVLQAGELEAALKATRNIFGQRNELRKWNGKSYETRINRAVFDIMIYYFSISEIREAALQHSEAIKKQFQEQCSDRFFLASLEATTKSKEANRVRFQTWASTLSAITGLKVASPIN